VGWTAAGGALGGDRLSIADRVGELAERVRDPVAAILGRGGGDPTDAAAGLGAASVAKLAGAGGVPKLVAACIGTGAAATACVAAGIGPIEAPERHAGPSPQPAGLERGVEHRTRALVAAPTTASAAEPERVPTGSGEPAASAATDPAPAPVQSPAPAAEQEFGIAPAPSAPEVAARPAPDGSTSGSAAAREFGP
jgi:hypothetical protein